MPLYEGGGEDDGDWTPTYVRLKDDDVRLEWKDDLSVAFGCGHETPERYDLYLKTDREEIKLEIDVASKHYKDSCGACRRRHLVETATRCTGCRRPILVGQNVSTMRGGIRCLDGCMDPMQITGTWNGTQVEPIKINSFPLF